MARPCKPTAILKASGSFRTDRHGGKLSSGVAIAPTKPSWVKGASADIWKEIVSTLPDGVLDRVDCFMLTGACKWYARWKKYEVELETGVGDEYKKTLLATMAWKNFDKAASKLGMSPTDRARLHIVNVSEEEDQPKARFFKQGT